MSERKTRTARKPPQEKRPPDASAAVVAPAQPGERELVVVGAVARRLGFAGSTFGEMAEHGWLRQVVELKDTGSELKGLVLARTVVDFLGGMLSGRPSSAVLGDVGLSWSTLVLVMEACPDFEKVLVDVYRIRRKMTALRKESMGEDVLLAAYELAVEGEEQHSLKDGADLGFKKKSEKMLDRLLVMSGSEFRKDGCVDGGGAVDRPAVSVTFNFGGGRAQSMGVVDVKQD